MTIVYLSRRNLLTLLSKLDRKAKGEDTNCGIIKNDTQHELYPCSERTLCIAVEDEQYYSTAKREPGEIHASDLTKVLEQK